MVNVHLTLGDVAATVFVVSPVQEAVFSLRAWCFPQVHPEHWRWLDHQRPA